MVDSDIRHLSKQVMLMCKSKHCLGGKPNHWLASNTVTPAKNRHLVLAVGVLQECFHGNVVQDRCRVLGGEPCLGKLPMAFPLVIVNKVTLKNIVTIRKKHTYCRGPQALAYFVVDKFWAILH